MKPAYYSAGDLLPNEYRVRRYGTAGRKITKYPFGKSQTICDHDTFERMAVCHLEVLWRLWAEYEYDIRTEA